MGKMGRNGIMKKLEKVFIKTGAILFIALVLSVLLKVAFYAFSLPAPTPVDSIVNFANKVLIIVAIFSVILVLVQILRW